MNASELLKRVILHGADENGIEDRFGGNAELYALCFKDFLEEPNFEALSRALADGDCKRAFEAAHALKGLAGNLGVTGFYDAICALVETLRSGSLDGTANEYSEVLRKKQALEDILNEKEPVPKEQSAGKAEDEDTPDHIKKRDRKFFVVAAAAIITLFAIVSLLFNMVGVAYRDTTVRESGHHLTETGSQIKHFVEDRISLDWMIARSVGLSIMDSAPHESDAAVLNILRRENDVWNASNLILYTESGYCVDVFGDTLKNDTASETVLCARRQGRYLTVIESNIVYTIPLETEVTLKGSKIAAVSVVRDMSGFLDNMDFSSFESAAGLYLTDNEGVVISMLSGASTPLVFNFKALTKGMEVISVETGAPEELFSADAPTAFLLSGEGRADYVVSSSVSTGEYPLRLFYLVPEAAANRTVKDFSQQLTVFSLGMIALFGALSFLMFILIYRARRRQFSKALAARQRMFDLLVSNTRTAFGLFTDGREKPDYISSNAQRVLGDEYWTLSREDGKYRMHGSQEGETEMLRQTNAALSAWDGKGEFRSGYIRNDSVTPPSYFELHLYPVEGSGGDFVGIAQDVTRVYQREQAVTEAMEMANRSNEAKSRFLSNMSHDIRTPMNAIMNMTNFALENIDQPKKLGPYLHTIHESSEHLLQLINDVLDMSRIESGQIKITSTPFNLKEELQKQSDMIYPLCGAMGQTFITNFRGLPEGTVYGDALKLSQITMNLLSNAVKFTPEKGAVRFTAMEIPSLNEDMVNIRLIIEDNGIGMSPQTMEHIFEPFSRADDNRVSRIEGTGLGLSICKSYVEAMGGSIRCESEEGEGSTFTVELFFQKTVVETEQQAAAGSCSLPFLGMHCLVAEDNPTNRIIAQKLLERIGFIVDFAEDGAQAVEKFLASRPGTYDIIYMDIRMPVMDGHRAAMSIRSGGHPQSESIPIIAMTANVFAEDIEKARLAGMDAYLGKPIVSFNVIDQTYKALSRKKWRET